MNDHVSVPSPPLAASETKHLALLHHPIPGTSIVLPLKQLSSTSTTNSSGTLAGTGSGSGTGATGTTLWLSSQLLALYFASLPLPPAPSPRHGIGSRSAVGRMHTVLDLGSGIGYLPLCLAQRGYRVIATDIPTVIESVLSHNITTGLDAITAHSNSNSHSHRYLSGPPDVQVTTLDWETVSETGQLPESLRGLKVDTLITSDTIYAPHLVHPLFETLRLISISISCGTGSIPTIYISLERRDSALVDSALGVAADMGLIMRRVDKGKVDRLMLEAGWATEEWDDVEIWKGKFTKSSLSLSLSKPAGPGQ